MNTLQHRLSEGRDVGRIRNSIWPLKTSASLERPLVGRALKRNRKLRQESLVVVSERPIAFAVEHPSGADPRIGVKTFGWMSHADQPGRYVVTVDVSGMRSYERQKRLLQQAKAQLCRLADALAKNELDLKWLLE